MGVWTAWLPYALVAILLVVTRVSLFRLDGLLNERRFRFTTIFRDFDQPRPAAAVSAGDGFHRRFADHPGGSSTVLRGYARAWGKSLRTMAAASTALVFTVPMVQVFINSGGGDRGFEAMPLALARGVEQLAGSAWPLFAPLIGGLGAAVAGSNTISNMMFSLFQFHVGESNRRRSDLDRRLAGGRRSGGQHDLRPQRRRGIGGCGTVGTRGLDPAQDPDSLCLLRGTDRRLGYMIVWHSSKGWLRQFPLPCS
jgi:hypothetical protein